MADKDVVRIKKTSTPTKVFRTIFYTLLIFTSLFIVAFCTYLLLVTVGEKTAGFIEKIEQNGFFIKLFSFSIIYAVLIVHLFTVLILIFTGRQGIAFKVIMTIFYLVLVGGFLFSVLPDFLVKFAGKTTFQQGNSILPKGHLDIITKINGKLKDNDKYVYPASYGVSFVVSLMLAIYFGTKRPKTGASVLMMIGFVFNTLVSLFLLGAHAVVLIKSDWNLFGHETGLKYATYGFIGIPILSHLIFTTAGLIGLVECKKN